MAPLVLIMSALSPHPGCCRHVKRMKMKRRHHDTCRRLKWHKRNMKRDIRASSDVGVGVLSRHLKSKVFNDLTWFVAHGQVSVSVITTGVRRNRYCLLPTFVEWVPAGSTNPLYVTNGKWTMAARIMNTKQSLGVSQSDEASTVIANQRTQQRPTPSTGNHNQKPFSHFSYSHWQCFSNGDDEAPVSHTRRSWFAMQNNWQESAQKSGTTAADVPDKFSSRQPTIWIHL